MKRLDRRARFVAARCRSLAARRRGARAGGELSAPGPGRRARAVRARGGARHHAEHERRRTSSSTASRSRASRSRSTRCARRCWRCPAAPRSAGRSSPSTARSCCSRRSRSAPTWASCARRSTRIDGRMAWIGNSEIAKGLHSGIGIARAAAGHAVAGVRHRRPGGAAAESAATGRAFDDKPGEVAGADRRRRRPAGRRRFRRPIRSGGRSASGVRTKCCRPIRAASAAARASAASSMTEDGCRVGRAAARGRRPAASTCRRCARPICSSSQARPGSAIDASRTAKASSPRSRHLRWHDRSRRGPTCASCRPAWPCCCCSHAMVSVAPPGVRVRDSGGSASPCTRGAHSRVQCAL